MPSVVIVDYGMGNIWSVKSALDYIGISSVTSSNPELIISATHLILPGVGSFRKAMKNLTESNIDVAIQHAVNSGSTKILGICLGMQLLGSQSTEDGFSKGLGLVTNKVDRFDKSVNKQEIKIPHVGFNLVQFSKNEGLFSNLPPQSDFYFVHSYRMLSENLDGIIGTCIYGEKFLAAFQMENIMGTQFHPEKSQTNGLQIIKNFIES